jgi:GT2 family glycosyltransferase
MITGPAGIREPAPPGGSWRRATYSADVSVVLVNYNTRDMLERALRSLFGSNPRASLDVVVVDNASRDGTVEMLRERFPAVRCVASTANVGHAVGCNTGMTHATGRYLFLLDTDTIVHEGALDALVSYLDRHPHVGAAGPKVLNIDGTLQGSVKSLPTPMAALFGRHSPLTRLFPGNRFSRRYLIYLERDAGRPFAAGSVSSCALMARREAVERAGPMDPRHFIYWDDVDWCRAIWEAGYEVHYVPHAVIIHDEHKGGSRAGRKQSLTSIIAFHRGAYLYYRKWHVRSAWSVAHGLALAGLTARAAVVLASEQLRWLFRRRRTS